MTTPAPVILPTGQILTLGTYPNPGFHRGQPLGVRGTALVGGRRLPAVRSNDKRVWCPAGASGDWSALLSPLSKDTFAPVPGPAAKP